MKPFRTSRSVEFSDTDMGGVVHFSRYLVFMETAEHQFLRSRGAEVVFDVNGRMVSWPRVEASCTYLAAARFGDQLDIEVRIVKRGRRSLTFSFSIWRAGAEIARGQMVSVCCVVDEGGQFTPIQIPAALAERLDETGGRP